MHQQKKTSYGFRLTSKAMVEIGCFLCFLAKALLLFSQQLPLFLLMQLPLSLLHSTDRTPDSKRINNGKAGWGDDIRDTFTWLSKSSSNHRQNLYLKNIQCQETKINSVSLPSPHGEMGSWQRYGRNIPYHLGPFTTWDVYGDASKKTPQIRPSTRNKDLCFSDSARRSCRQCSAASSTSRSWRSATDCR